MRTVSLMTANQQLSRLAREVERGQRFVITRRGRPIAELVPYAADPFAADNLARVSALLGG